MIIGKVSILSGNIHRLYNDDVTFIPVCSDQAPAEDQRQNIETRRSLGMMRDSMDMVTTRPKARDSRSQSQAADYADYDCQTIDEEEETFNVEGDPLEFGTNNNQLALDGVKEEINYDDNDVEIMSSSPSKKNSTRGQRSKCAECNQMISTTNLSRHIKRYHCPGGKSFQSAKSSRRQNKTKSVKVKCEFCGKNLAQSYLAKHIQEVHQSKQCRWCGLTFSFRNSLIDHEMSCRESVN